MNRIPGFWIRTAETGLLDIDEQTAMQPELEEMTARGKRGPRAGWASLVAFLAASALLPLSFTRRDENSNRRCEAIQKDMLSVHPQRTDDTAIFQALGCKAQGSGSVYASNSGPSSSE